MQLLKDQAKTHQENGDWAGAIKLWEEIHTTAPGKADLASWTGLARCYQKLGDLVKAQDAAQNALSIKTTHVPALGISAKIAMVQEDWHRAAELWRVAAQTAAQPKPRLNAEISLAKSLIELGAFQDAETLLEKLQQDAPQNPAIWELLAKMAEKRKSTAEARERWTTYQAKFPQQAANSAAYLKFAGGEASDETAQAKLDALRTADADEAQSILSYLGARTTKGEYAELLRQAAEKFPTVPALEANFLAARTGNLSSQKELDDTLSRASRFIDRFPSHPRGWRLLANVHVAANDPAAVQHVTDQAVKRGGDSFATDVLNAWAAQATGDHDRATHYGQRARKSRYTRAEDTSNLDLRLLNAEPNAPLKDKILLFAGFQNERAFAPWFLDYYRSIGVDWFFLVDNQSQDGTDAYLAQQKDVTVYSSSDVFLSVSSGMCWVNALIERFGDDNWCIFVDADEQLVVPNIETQGLRPFLDGMATRGEEALSGYMLDTYPANMPEAISFQPGDDPLAVSRLIDPGHFFSGTTDCCYLRARGGVRSRLFGTREVLEKTPILRGGGGRLFKDNHYIAQARVSSQTAVLLHHKILRDALDAAQEGVGHASRIQERRALCRVRHAKYRSAGYYEGDGLPKGPDVLEYHASDQLTEHGLIGTTSKLTQSDASKTNATYARIDD